LVARPKQPREYGIYGETQLGGDLGGRKAAQHLHGQGDAIVVRESQERLPQLIDLRVLVVQGEAGVLASHVHVDTNQGQFLTLMQARVLPAYDGEQPRPNRV
jgi:hypothetical protein